MLFSALNTLLDLCIAMGIITGFVVALPLLTLSGGLLTSFVRRFASSSSSTRSSVPRRQSRDEDAGGAGDLVLFCAKGMVLWMLLMQTSTQCGGPAAAWVVAVVVERAARVRDRSLLLLIEPAPGPLDYLYLLIIAPLLGASAGGMVGISAAWHAYLCAAFFWRTRAPIAAALGLSTAAQFFAYLIGLFSWQKFVPFGLSPWPESIPDAILLVPAVIVVMLIPPKTRRWVLLLACYFSPTFRLLAKEVLEYTYAALPIIIEGLTSNSLYPGLYAPSGLLKLVPGGGGSSSSAGAAGAAAVEQSCRAISDQACVAAG